jgi:hypothetical protein
MAPIVCALIDLSLTQEKFNRGVYISTKANWLLTFFSIILSACWLRSQRCAERRGVGARARLDI